jgi:hypothetical protein
MRRVICEGENEHFRSSSLHYHIVATPHVTGHDLSVLSEMSEANRGLRSRAARVCRKLLPCAAGCRVAQSAKRQLKTCEANRDVH